MLTHLNGPDARLAVASSINSGRGLVHFSGHSNTDAWFGDPNIPNSLSTVLLDKPNINLNQFQ